jgi:hypothetical protein
VTNGDLSNSTPHPAPSLVRPPTAFSAIGWLGLVAGILAVLLIFASAALATWNLRRAAAEDSLAESVRGSLIASKWSYLRSRMLKRASVVTC